jgi:hypothetical protein
MLVKGTSEASLTARTVSVHPAANSDSRHSCRTRKIERRYRTPSMRRRYWRGAVAL